MENQNTNFHSSIFQVASMIKNKDEIKAREKAEMQKKKRDRKANYSKEETDKLVELVLARKDILESDKKNADAWIEKKEVWEEIEREFNKNLGIDDVYRDIKTLKIKYMSLKKDIKKKWLLYLNKRKDPSAKLPKFTTAERKFRDVVLPSMEGFCDFAAIDVEKNTRCDSDDISSASDDNESATNNTYVVKVEREASDEDISKSDCLVEETPIIRHDPFVGIQNSATVGGQPAIKRLRKASYFGVQQIDNIHNEEEKRLQIEILEEELENKKLQRRILEQEIEQKRVIFELEKKHLELKIKALKN